jgi:hypothetical protein
MSHHLSRRALLTGLAATGAVTGAAALTRPGAGAAAEDTAYAGFRVVRQAAGPPSAPEVILPAGYTWVSGSQYQAASRAEWYGFVTGARNDTGVRVGVRWPGVPIRTVVAGEKRRPLTRDPAEPGLYWFTLPVWRASAGADSPTVQIWSYLGPVDSGLEWLMPHNDPDRMVGAWTSGPFPAVESQAVITMMVACAAVLRDSGMVARAQARQQFFSLEGFETNNLMHVDNPPHWHLAYYPGPGHDARPATVPHFWVDAQGRTVSNGQDRQGARFTAYHPNEPAPIFDGQNNLVITTTIRPDGGLDIDSPDGLHYSIFAPDGHYGGGPVQILKGGAAWRTVATSDDYRSGILRTDTRGAGSDPVRDRFEYHYDPLTGPITSTRRY